MNPLRFATSAALAAALIMPPSATFAGPAQPRGAAGQSREPLCRRAAPLPPLPPEAERA